MNDRRRWISETCCVLLLLNALPASAGDKPAAPARTDLYGDLLPEGAIARLGTMRWRHGFETSALAFSPDGKILASGGGRNVGLCLWDAVTGRRLHEFRNPPSVRSLTFSPDGKTILVNASATLLDVATGREVRRFKEERRYYASIAFSADGRTVAAGEYRLAGVANVTVWDAATGKKLHRLAGHTEEISALAFSPDSKTLASSSQDQTIRLWDLTTGKELYRLEGTKDYAQSLAFSPDGTILASPGTNHVIRLWDVKTGTELRQLKGHEGLIGTVAFSKDGKLLASGGRDGIRLWEVETGKELRRWQAHVTWVSSVAFSPDGKTLASAGGVNHAIRLWDAATGKAINPAVGHTGMVRSLMFSADGKTLFSCGRDNNGLEWDVAAGTERRRLHGGRPEKWWSGSVLSPDGKLLATGGYVYPDEKQDPIVHVWDTTTGKELHTLSESGISLSPMTFSPDGKTLVTGSEKSLRLWDMVTGKKLHLLSEPQPLAVAFSQDGKFLFSTGIDRLIRVWDTGTGNRIRQWGPGADPGLAAKGTFSPLGPLVLSADGRFVAAADWPAIRVWNAINGKDVRQFYGLETGFGLALSPSGRLLANSEIRSKTLPNGDVINEDTIHLWELTSGQEIHRFDGHAGYTWSLTFAPDGRTLASGGGDSTIVLWDLTGRMRDGRLVPARLTAADLDRLWTDLGGEAAKARRTLWTLVAAEAQALALLKARLRPAPAPDRRRLAKLVADLDDRQFAVREKAAEELAKHAELAEPALRKALESKPSLEIRRRVEKLLGALAEPLTSPEALRVVRAVEVLEHIGTAEAQAILRELAQGAPEARLTQEAKASLARLAKRTANPP